MNYKVVFGSTFLRRAKKLKRRYRHIGEDIKAAVYFLQESPRFAVVIPKSNGMRKLRVRSTDQASGGQGGYRLVYYVTEQPEKRLYLLYIFAKSQESDVSPSLLRNLQNDLEQAIQNN